MILRTTFEPTAAHPNITLWKIIKLQVKVYFPTLYTLYSINTIQMTYKSRLESNNVHILHNDWLQKKEHYLKVRFVRYLSARLHTGEQFFIFVIFLRLFSTSQKRSSQNNKIRKKPVSQLFKKITSDVIVAYKLRDRQLKCVPQLTQLW